MTMARHLAITMGDPAGIGPEIIVKAAAKLRDRLASGDLRLLIIGSGAALRSAQEQLGLGQPIPEVGDGEWAHLGFLQADREGEPIRPGTLSAVADVSPSRPSSRLCASRSPAGSPRSSPHP